MVTGTHVSHSPRTELRECGKTNGRVNTTPHFTVGAGSAGEPGSRAGAKRAFNGLILPPLHTVPAIILTKSKLGGEITQFRYEAINYNDFCIVQIGLFLQ